MPALPYRLACTLPANTQTPTCFRRHSPTHPLTPHARTTPPRLGQDSSLRLLLEPHFSQFGPQVCVHFAHKVLAGRGPSPGGGLPLQDFTAAWRAAVPHGLSPSLDMLRAEALIEGGPPACMP